MNGQSKFINEFLCPFMTARGGEKGFLDVHCHKDCIFYTGEETDPCHIYRFLSRINKKTENQKN